MNFSRTIILILLSFSLSFAQSLLFEENFDYPVGTNLTLYGWTGHSAGGSNPIQIVTPGLIYPNYPPSGVGNAVGIVSGSGSREDDSKNFSSVSSGSLFNGFMVNVGSATTAGEYFFHLSEDPLSTSFFRGKIFVKSNAGSNIAFGLAKGNNSDTIYTDYLYNINTTYLVILEYIFNPGSTDDAVNLWIDPSLAGGPPQPNITQTDASGDPSNLGTVALRQSGTSGPVLLIDGIRIGDSWSSITSGTATNPPIISNVLYEPFPANQTFDITCDVSIATGIIDSVKLYYYTNFDLNNLDSVSMSATIGNQYIAGLSAQQNGHSFIYWVKAWGNNISSQSAQNKVIIGSPDIGIFHSQLDANGLPLHLDHLARLRGIVTVSAGVFSTDNYDFYMQDNTGGINIFDYDYTADSTQYQQGDSLEVVGMIDVYNGKVEIADFTAEILSSSNPLPPPIDVNIEDMGEEYEGRLISIDGVSIAPNGGLWPSIPIDSNLVITDGTGELTLRIEDSTYIGGNPEPTWPVTVIGIGNQYDLSPPYDGFYQILPRSYADFIPTSITGVEQVIHEYRLSQNYPNPFNPETRIQYSLKRAGEIDFRIFNILGQEVYRLTAKKPSGTQELVFDGWDLPSGIYFYQLKAGDFKGVRKMVLSR